MCVTCASLCSRRPPKVHKHESSRTSDRSPRCQDFRYIAALGKGYVVATSDHGHGRPASGSFNFNEDGSLNTTVWQDFAERSVLEQAEKTKALAKLYYAKPHRYAYDRARHAR
jgi:hypothetical protein